MVLHLDGHLFYVWIGVIRSLTYTPYGLDRSNYRLTATYHQPNRKNDKK